MVIYTWRTKKVLSGFEYRVLKIIPRNTSNIFGYYAYTTTIKRGILPTRTRAKLMAQKWVKYYNAKRRKK